MYRWRRAALVLLLAALFVPRAATAAPADTPLPPPPPGAVPFAKASLAVLGQPYDSLTRSAELGPTDVARQVLREGDGPFWALVQDDGRTVEVGAAGWRVVASAPVGDDLRIGAQEHVSRIHPRDVSRPALWVSSPGRGCGDVDGRFEVHDIGWRPDGQLSRLWLTFEQHCEKQVPAVIGELRLGMPTEPVMVAPQRITWPETYPNLVTVLPITVLNRGRSPWVAQGSRLEAVSTPPAHRLHADGCVGRTLQPGQSCIVQVRYVPPTAGRHEAVLVVPGPARATRVHLSGTGVEGNTALVLSSDFGDSVGNGEEHYVTPGEWEFDVSGTAERLTATVTAVRDRRLAWKLYDLTAGAGNAFEVGQTYPVQLEPGPHDPHVDFYDATQSIGRDCHKQTGSFTIHELAFESGPEPRIEHLSLSFAQTCEWSPNGTLFGSLAYRSALPVPEPRPASARLVSRFAGDDRYGTATALAEAMWPNPPYGNQQVFLASGENYADALAAAPVAALYDTTLLLTTRTRLPVATGKELERLSASDLIVVGGTAAIAADIHEQLTPHLGAALDVQRVNGADRYATAALLTSALSQTIPPPVAQVLVASGRSPADAVSAGGAAAAVGTGVLLVEPGAVPKATADALRQLRPKRVVVVGGTTAVSETVITQLRRITGSPTVRLAGRDRYETSAVVGKAMVPDARSIVLATGQDYPDALTAVTAVRRTNGMLLLSRPDCLPGPVRRVAMGVRHNRITVVGGNAALSDRVADLRPCQ